MPDAQDALADPRAYQEQIAKAQALPREHLAELVREQKRESEESTSTLRQQMQERWDLWANEVDFPDKEDWQAQIFPATPFAAVEQAGALIQRSLLDSPDFFGVEGQDAEDKLRAAHVVKPLLARSLGLAGAVPKYADACKVGFMLGVAGYLKLRWATSRVPAMAGTTEVDAATGRLLPSLRTRTTSALVADYVLPWRIFRDPDSRPREQYSGTYLYHSEFKGRPEIRAMVGRGWHADAVERLLARTPGSASRDAQGRTTSQEAEADRRQHRHVRHKFRTDYLVDEGWLDILDQHGDVVLPNALMVHSDGEILYGPTDSPLWATDVTTGRRKWPFIAGAPLFHPARFEGRGLLEADEDLSLLMANILNLSVDGMSWDLNPDAEVYLPGLENWDDMAVFPGKLWKKTIREPVITAVERRGFPLDKALAFFERIDAIRENVNFVTRSAIGAPSLRDTTATENRIKAGQSLGIFDVMGRNLEQAGRDLVALAWDFELQFRGGNDYMEPSVARLLGPHNAALLAELSLAERIDMLGRPYDFTFTGVTQAMQRADMLQKVMQGSALAMSAPFVGLTRPAQWLKVILDLMGLMGRIDIYEPQPAAAPPGMPPGVPGTPGAAGPGMGGGEPGMATPGAPVALENPAAMVQALGGDPTSVQPQPAAA